MLSLLANRIPPCLSLFHVKQFTLLSHAREYVARMRMRMRLDSLFIYITGEVGIDKLNYARAHEAPFDPTF